VITGKLREVNGVLGNELSVGGVEDLRSVRREGACEYIVTG